jgi:flagellar protein FliS
MMNNPQEAYRRQGVLTASPLELIVMLYDGLRKNIVLAQRSLAKNDVESAHNCLLKAQNIISELMNCLDLSFQISEELMKLYDFLFRGLVESNIKKCAERLGDYLDLVDELRSAWIEVGSIQRNAAAPGLEAGQA